MLNNLTLSLPPLGGAALVLSLPCVNSMIYRYWLSDHKPLKWIDDKWNLYDKSPFLTRLATAYLTYYTSVNIHGAM